MHVKQILEFMDTSINNAETCESILAGAGFPIEKYRESVDAMIAARAKFKELNNDNS